MEERRFKIREDLIITARSDRGRSDYMVLNPLSGDTACFSQKTYLILRHFNAKTIEEVQRHLKERHNLNLSRKALESYADLFLDKFLFDRDCFDLYYDRLSQEARDMLVETLRLWAQNFVFQNFEQFPFVEELVLNQAMSALNEGKIIEAIKYFKDLKKLNPQNAISDSALRQLEESLSKARKETSIRKKLDKRASLKYAVTAGVLLAVAIFSQSSFFKPGYRANLLGNREQSLRIIKTASDILIREKSLALTRQKFGQEEI